MTAHAHGVDEIIARLRRRLARDGLNIVLPLSASDFDAAVGPHGPAAHDLLSGAGGALVVGDGGPAFFEAFFEAFLHAVSVPVVQLSGAADTGHGEIAFAAADPLDAYTTHVVRRAVEDTLGEGQGDAPARGWRLFFPFVQARPALPFQRLGQAAGLPPPGPLGIQIHPLYGPWWAYRALVMIDAPLRTAVQVVASCVRCSRPCVAACPGAAVFGDGFAYHACSAHRMGIGKVACATSCSARVACPVGGEHRYPDRQLAFHMRASLPIARD